MKPYVVISILLSLVFNKLSAQEPLPVFEKAVYVSKQDSLPYRLLYPQNYNPNKKYPVILYLHGAGLRGNDNTSPVKYFPTALISTAAREQFNCFILVPQCPKNDVWVKFPNFPKNLEATKEPTKSTSLVLELLNKLRKQLPLDKNKIYLTGYSMGGEGALDLLNRKPKLFAAAIAVCPVADTAKAKIISKIPVWIFHGELDDVNNVKYSRMMVGELKKLGGAAKYTEYAGVKHNSWEMAYREPDLLPWLFSKEKF